MSTKPSPASSVLRKDHSRKTSTGSQLSKQATIDFEAKNEVLDQIHNAASRTEGLTSFHFGSPPRPPSTEGKGLATDLVPGGLSSLYSRLRATVGVSREQLPQDQNDDASSLRSISKLVATRTSTAESSASRGASTPVSRVQSPLSSTFAASASMTSPDPSKQSMPNLTDNGTASLTPSTHDTRMPAGEGSGQRSRTLSPASQSVAKKTPAIDKSRPAHAPLSQIASTRTTTMDETPTRKQGHKQQEPELLPPAEIKPLERPPLIHVSQSHLPGFRVSQENSADEDLSSVTTGSSKMRRKAVEPKAEPREKVAELREVRPADPAARLKSKVLAKELWMRDETAKECFYCGEPFSTFRRKHHCRICGNIFDGKCTNLVPGRLFGQSGSLRICRPCEGMVYGNDDDDSSNYTDDGDRHSIHGAVLSPKVSIEDSRPDVKARQFQDDLNMEAPTLGIPVARKGGESKRGSAVIEFTNEHNLARPSSSRSLKSLSGLQRGPNHKRYNSRQIHQHLKSLRSQGLEHAPFQKGSEGPNKTNLPALHHDNIIDPDLAQFMSDEELSEDDATSIFATLNADVQSPGKDGERTFPHALMLPNKRRMRDRGGSTASREADSVSLFSKSQSKRRFRNTSIGNLQHPSRSSPRRTKSNSLLRGFNVGSLSGSPTIGTSPVFPATANSGSYKMIRSSAMRGASAPAVELNQASLQHVRNLLKQMIRDAEIPEGRRWERALLPILLQCTDDVNPDVHRNDDIDIRQYIKLKKIPGSKPGDTAYVSGVVFTKNLALKSMPRSLHEPRVLIVTFPIEYARHHTHFMSLDPVIAQEKEYLSNLIKRIVALNPSVLLVEKNVSGLALGYLQEAGIAVVYNVKQSVLSAVCRCTKTKLITSVDKLSLASSELGRCESFGVKTYVHGGIKKTYIYFSGCQKDLGCTIVLRGAEKPILRKIKRIAEFMSYVVYNLKLETCVMRDEYVLIPVSTPAANAQSLNTAEQIPVAIAAHPKAEIKPTDFIKETVEQVDGQQEEINSLIRTSSTAGSIVSHFEKRSVENQADEVQIPDSAKCSTGPTFYSDIVKEHETRITSSSPFVKFSQPHILKQARESETKLVELRKLRDQYMVQHNDEKAETSATGFELVQPEMVHKMLKNPSKPVKDFLFAVHDAEYEAAKHSYQTQKRLWEAYMSSNPTMFDPSNHQRIACLYSMVNSKTNPCVGPEIIALSFYGEHDLDDEFLPDITLGQYVEELCQSGEAPCSAEDCEDTMFQHHRQYVHGDGQLNVTVQPHPARIRGMQKTILMWSACRICGQETQIQPMSENTWKYSFGKYLELSFWSTTLHPRAHTCEHDIHRDHVRYFGFSNVAIRVQYDSIQIYDIIPPRPTINWKVDKDLMLKNDQYNRFKTKLDRFVRSVRLRIESIHVDSMPPEKIEDCQAEVETLLARVKDDHISLTRKLQEKYMNSRWYEIIPLNRAARAIQEVSIEWDNLFAEFESNFFPSEKDIRRMTALQLKKLFESATSFTTIEEPQEDENGELKDNQQTSHVGSPPEITRRISVMSPEDTKNVLVSAIQEQHIQESPKDEQNPEVEPIDRPMPMTQHEAANVESVKHLDLAISPEHSSSSGEGDQTSAVNPVSPESTVNLKQPSSPNGSEDHVDVKQEGLTEQANNTNAENAAPESRIPRPIESTRRMGATSVPPFSRSQSTPQGSGIQRSTALTEPTEDVLTPPLSKTDKFRYLLSEPARAFERSMVGRITSKGRNHPSLIPRSVPGKRNVLNLARHYEQLTREFEKQRRIERQMRDTRGAYPLASSTPVVEVYRDAHEAVQGTDTVDDAVSHVLDQSSVHVEHTPTTNTVDQTTSEQVRSSAASSHAPEDVDQRSTRSHSSETADHDTSQNNTIDTDDGTLAGSDAASISPDDSQLDLSQLKEEKTSVLRMLANFWSERTSSGWLPLEYPFAASEHVWGDSDIIVREDEPSSIIALALSSTDYLAKLKSFRREPVNATHEDIDVSIERNLLHSKNTNIRYAFQNRGVRAQCKIFYAESFDALRRKCGISERFVESLSRCLKWDSKGGKTKSLFLKTLDDRFVLKSLSAVEVNSFFKFAPDYFVYAHAMLFNGLPSVIAKMLGLFQVTIRNPASGMEFNWFMIVMENLFYDRLPNRRFDLKGSMRNRKIQSTGERDEVLLDENLVDIIFEKPIFVREHTMKMLTASVWNDTLFLSKQNVMDYSLMAGFEDDHREIIVGIIDCIRTYTWDKKLETWIKDRGKNKPTVTSPKDYRNRFRVAMSKYILLAPNCWHQFQAQQIQGRPVTFAGHGGNIGGEEELVATTDLGPEAPVLGRTSTGPSIVGIGSATAAAE